MIEDGDFTTISSTGGVEISYPIKSHPAHYTIEQKMLVKAANYTGPPLDAVHPTYGSAYCVGDSSPSTRGPLLSLTREWSTIPAEANFSDIGSVTFPAFGWESTAAEYSLVEEPGVAYQIFGAFEPRSSSLTLTVPVRRHVAFVLPGISGVSTIEEVPMYPRFRVVDANGVAVANTGSAGADPDFTKYKSWVLNGVEIVAEGTTISKYLGNIWRVETVYAKAR